MRLLTLTHGLQRFFGRQSRASAQVPLTVKSLLMLSAATHDAYPSPRSTHMTSPDPRRTSARSERNFRIKSLPDRLTGAGSDWLPVWPGPRTLEAVSPPVTWRKAPYRR
jgi:hypothetical protein